MAILRTASPSMALFCESEPLEVAVALLISLGLFFMVTKTLAFLSSAYVIRSVTSKSPPKQPKRLEHLAGPKGVPP